MNKGSKSMQQHDSDTGSLWGQLDPWNEKDLERIHQASLQILEKTGVQVENDTILDILDSTGAHVDRDRRVVKFDAARVQERLDKAPGSWDRHAGTPGPFSVSADCGSSFVWDYNTRRPRAVVPRDLIDAPRLVQALEHIDEVGNLVFTAEIPAVVLDLIAYRQLWNHTEKKGGGALGRNPSSVNTLSPAAFDYLCDMLEVKIGAEERSRGPALSFFMGVASPLRWGPGILKMALHALNRGQAVGIGGNCVSGIQSPITPAANAAVDHAERLSGLYIVTSIRPDAAFYFCNHTYLLDMISGDIASGSPEQTLQALLGKKLLEYCGFQLFTNHPILDTGAHVPDAQSAVEKAMYMLLTALGGAKGIGGAGQLKETFCYEQMVIDHEIAGYIKHLIRGATINEATVGLEDIVREGAGGNFLTCETTVKFMRECYYVPQLFYRRRMSEWLREGAKDTLERAHEKVEGILSSETPEFLSRDQLSAMDEIIRKACGELAPGWDPIPWLDGRA